VLGAAYGMPWLGVVVVPIVVVLHIAIAFQKQDELFLILAAGAVGFCVDSVLVAFGVFSPVAYLLPAPFSPPWMVLLWMNFAITLNASLKKLHGRYTLSALLGAVSGPAAYYSGAKLGAATELPTISDLVVLSAVWAAAVPALFWIAAKLNEKQNGKKRW
jgi:hypothetical protein